MMGLIDHLYLLVVGEIGDLAEQNHRLHIDLFWE
jgi:hypothetical protein